MKQSSATKKVTLFGGAVLLLLMSMQAFWFYKYITDLQYAHKAVTQDYQVIVQVQALLNKIKDAELGQRGYLLTDQADYLQAYEATVIGSPKRNIYFPHGYNTATRSIGENIALLYTLTQNTSQLRRVVELQSLILRKISFLQETVAGNSQASRIRALSRAKGSEAKLLTDQIRAKTTQIIQVELDELEAINAKKNALFQRFEVLVISTISLIFINLIFIAFLLLSYFKNPND